MVLGDGGELEGRLDVRDLPLERRVLGQGRPEIGGRALMGQELLHENGLLGGGQDRGEDRVEGLAGGHGLIDGQGAEGRERGVDVVLHGGGDRIPQHGFPQGVPLSVLGLGQEGVQVRGHAAFVEAVQNRGVDARTFGGFRGLRVKLDLLTAQTGVVLEEGLLLVGHGCQGHALEGLGQEGGSPLEIRRGAEISAALDEVDHLVLPG